MLIHTSVSTSLPDNDKNHCHYYNGMAGSRVTAHRAVRDLVRFPDRISHQYTFLSVFESMCHLTHASMMIKYQAGIVLICCGTSLRVPSSKMLIEGQHTD